MVQVVYKKRRVRTELQPNKHGFSAPASQTLEHKEPRMRALHLRQFGISGEKNELLIRMQQELDALHNKPTQEDE